MQDRHRALAFFLYNSSMGIFLTYGLFFTKVAGEFNLPPSSTSFIFGTFALLFGVSSLLMGLVMDLYGAANAILIGGLLMGAGLIASSAATSFGMLLGAYGLLAGLGTGSMWLPTSFVIFDRFEADKIRETTGLVSAGTPFGTLVFSPLEAFLIISFGWRAAFLWVGLIVVIFTAFAYAASRGGKTMPHFNLRAAFRTFRERRFGYLYIYYLAGNAFARTLTLIFVVPLFEARGMGLFAGTLALTLIGIGSILGRFTTRVRRFSEETVASLGFILQGLCIVGMLFSRDFVAIAVVSLGFGLGYGAYVPQFALMMRKYYGTQNYGTIFGTLLTSFGIGAFAGPVFEGYQLSLSGTYSFGFYVASIASVIIGLHLLVANRGPKGTRSRLNFLS